MGEGERRRTMRRGGGGREKVNGRQEMREGEEKEKEEKSQSWVEGRRDVGIERESGSERSWGRGKYV